jgi:hypothetical protein
MLFAVPNCFTLSSCCSDFLLSLFLLPGLSSRMDKDISWLPQYSVARLLGFFVHGVEIHGLVQHNRVNNFR